MTVWILGIAAVLLVAWFVFQPAPRKLDLVDSIWPGAQNSCLVARDISYGDDPRQKFDLYAPAGHQASAAKTRPLLVFFHGGGWYKGAREHYRFAGRAFASRGFIVAVPSYRYAPAHLFPAFVEDGAAAVAKARALGPRYGADPGRIVLAGHSAGAHIAALIALDPRYLEAAGVPASAIRGVAGLSGPYDFHPFTADSAKNAMGHVRPPELTQPIHFVSTDAPPMLLATGSEDVTVKPRNTHSLARALDAAGVEVAVKDYSGLNHNDVIMAISRPFRGKAPVLDDAAAFLHRVAGE